jgi:hypothetical protein
MRRNLRRLEDHTTYIVKNNLGELLHISRTTRKGGTYRKSVRKNLKKEIADLTVNISKTRVLIDELMGFPLEYSNKSKVNTFFTTGKYKEESCERLESIEFIQGETFELYVGLNHIRNVCGEKQDETYSYISDEYYDYDTNEVEYEYESYEKYEKYKHCPYLKFYKRYKEGKKTINDKYIFVEEGKKFINSKHATYFHYGTAPMCKPCPLLKFFQCVYDNNFFDLVTGRCKSCNNKRDSRTEANYGRNICRKCGAQKKKHSGLSSAKKKRDFLESTVEKINCLSKLATENDIKENVPSRTYKKLKPMLIVLHDLKLHISTALTKIKG